MARMRRVGVVLLLALATAGCGARTETVPGPAAPLTATGTPTSTQSAPSTPAGTPSASPAKTQAPADLRIVTMTGAGLSLTFPVPDSWTLTSSRTAALSRTDVALADKVLLRVDLTARETGTARSGAEGAEAGLSSSRPGYRRLDIADVAGVGDDAVDWLFSYDQDGTPARVVDRQILSGAGMIAVYLRAPTASWARYLPVWQRTATDLVIAPS